TTTEESAFAGGKEQPNSVRSMLAVRLPPGDTAIQRALQWSVAIGLGQLAIARGKDERRAAGNEGIGNWRGRLAVEIGVEDRKVEVGVLRRFQRLVDTRGFGGDGVAEFAEHVLQQHGDHHLVFDDEDPLGLRRGLRFGCHSSALRWNGTHPGRIGLTMHCGRPGATGLRESPRISTRCGGAFWPNRRELSRHLKYMARATDS